MRITYCHHLMRRIGLMLAAACLTTACDTPIQSQPSQEHQAMPTTTADPLLVNTHQGRVRGFWADETHQVRGFKGIPYAAPPVGTLRWRPPQAAAVWQEVRDATRAGPACWQPVKQEQFVWSRGDFPRSEDCLHLNLWSAAEPDHPAPVMVWFHGGSHTAGMGHDKIFDGTELAKRGVVLVTINYRLGPFGFLAHPLLNRESDHDSSGNYGLLDKIAALNWVRDNIAEFGGDPGNVTIFGQSAGSQSVCALMASPLARGLFHKAIGQSAACVDPLPQPDPAGLERGSALADALDQGADLDRLRAASAEQIMAAADTSDWASRSRIVIDGWVLPEPPDQTFAAGRQAQVPLLLGSLANEGNQLFPVREQLALEQLQAYLQRLAGSYGDTVLSHYQRALEHSPGLAQREIATDLFMAYGMRRWAMHHQRSGQPTYLYFLDHQPPAFRLYVPDRPDLQLPDGPRSAGAYHSGDLAYVFANTGKVGAHWQPEDHELSRQMASMWTNFAKSGDPNGEQLPHWPRFHPGQMSTLRISERGSRDEPGVRREILDLWDRRFSDDQD